MDSHYTINIILQLSNSQLAYFNTICRSETLELELFRAWHILQKCAYYLALFSSDLENLGFYYDQNLLLNLKCPLNSTHVRFRVYFLSLIIRAKHRLEWAHCLKMPRLGLSQGSKVLGSARLSSNSKYFLENCLIISQTLICRLQVWVCY